MMEGWKEVKFGDVVQFPPKISLKKGLEYPFIPMEDIEIGVKYVKSNSKKRLTGGGAKFESGDTLFARITPSLENGKIAQAKNLSGPAFGSTEYFIFRGKEGITDSDFIFYLVNTHQFKQNAINSMVGASGRQRADAGFVRGLKIDLPPLPTQRKIASILSAYDDLIENNLKRIKLLEEKAQLTYEEWFSVKGTPNGWNEYKLGELIDFHIGGGWGEEFQTDGFPDPAYVIRGTDMDNLPLGSIENVPNRWHKVSNLKSRRLKHGDIVFEVSGGSSYEGVAKTLLITEGLLNQFDGDVMCASFCKLMRPKSVSYSYALILFLKYLRKTKSTEIFEKRSASNIVNYNWEAFLKFQSVKMPNDELLKEFNDIVEPMISSIYNLGNQITKLKEARDILLPRLMTGMINVEQMNLGNLQPKTA
ncbi:MAG: restriction endonuclease subunit S [Candidatus Arcticimaribacter sp.]